MAPRYILPVSVIYLALGVLSMLSFLFLPSVIEPNDWIGRLICACCVILLIWLSVKITQRKRLAWYVGTVIFGPVALFAAFVVVQFIAQQFLVDIFGSSSASNAGGVIPLPMCLFMVLYVFAFLMLYLHRGVRQLFRVPSRADGLDVTISSAEDSG